MQQIAKLDQQIVQHSLCIRVPGPSSHPSIHPHLPIESLSVVGDTISHSQNRNRSQKYIYRSLSSAMTTITRIGRQQYALSPRGIVPRVILGNLPLVATIITRSGKCPTEMCTKLLLLGCAVLYTSKLIPHLFLSAPHRLLWHRLFHPVVVVIPAAATDFYICFCTSHPIVQGAAPPPLVTDCILSMQLHACPFKSRSILGWFFGESPPGVHLHTKSSCHL